MKKRKLIIFIVVILLILIFLIYLFIPKKSSYLSANQQICINEKCFNIELAKTESERKQGLMYRTHLNEDSGMLFLFQEESKHAFWMKNTLLPLDLIWIDKNKDIIKIKKETPPCLETTLCPSYFPDSDSLYVLEINGGLTEKYNIIPGQKANFKNIRLQ